MNERNQQDARNIEQHASTLKHRSEVLHLSLAVSTAVPIRMLELLKRGGPEEEDFARVHTYVQDFVQHGVDLLFPTSTAGSTADRFEQIVDAIAVLAFCPGGVTILGEHYEGPVSERQQA